MKRLFFTLFSFAMAFNANALIIKGEESDTDFVQVNKVGEEYYFLDCRGDFNSFHCEPFYELPTTFNEEEMMEMSNRKKGEAIGVAAADIGISILALRVLPVVAAKAEIAYALSRGFSLDGGVGGVSALASMVTVTPALVSTTVIFDKLDPFVHRDLSLSLKAATDNADFGELDDIDAKDIRLDRVVSVEDVTTLQVREALKEMTDDIVHSRPRGPRSKYKSPIPAGITIY